MDTFVEQIFEVFLIGTALKQPEDFSMADLWMGFRMVATGKNLPANAVDIEILNT